MTTIKTINWVAVTCLLIVGTAAGLIVGMVVGGAAVPSELGDTGAFLRWGTPSFRTINNVAQAISIGSLVFVAFALATALGVPLGLFMGWSTKIREYLFPVFEMLRPIPILAWVPLAIIMFTSLEAPVIFLAFLASFFVTTLNTMLGVESIDESYFRAAQCLGANDRQVFIHVVVPGAMPFIFTGLQISIGVCWFSLVAAEMVSGQYGLGYVINNSYTNVRYPTIIIGMVTLGFVGYITSALVRMVGNRLMQWRMREIAMSNN
jgi:ABC-type nitrate/sulfonate/bicarbonate transport system permease component